MVSSTPKQCMVPGCYEPREGLNDYCKSCGDFKWWPHWLMAIPYVAAPILAFLGVFFQWHIDPSIGWPIIYGALSLAALWGFFQHLRTPPNPRRSARLWVTALAGIFCLLAAISNLTS